MNLIVSTIKKQCMDVLKNSRCKRLPFHSVQHTLEVFENVQLIGGHEHLDSKEIEILKIAALCHDTGFSETYNGHEDLSAHNAHIFLRDLDYETEAIEKVLSCINATKMPQHPETHLERVICDADLFHLSSTAYLQKNKLLRIEWQTYLNLTFSDEDWYLLNLDFLSEHHFHTEYGKTVLRDNKIKNIRLLEKLRTEAIT